jgi:hypothetical protein
VASLIQSRALWAFRKKIQLYKSFPTLYDPSLFFLKESKVSRDKPKDSHIIGSLMYLASTTIPDISFAMSKLSFIVSNFGDDHCMILIELFVILKTLWVIVFTIPGIWGYQRVIVIQTGYPTMLMRGHKWVYVYTWWWRCFLKVLQADHLNKVDNRSRTHSIRYNHCWSRVALRALDELSCGWIINTRYSYELW